MSSKKELRKFYRELRANIPPARAEALSLSACRTAMESPEFAAAQNIHVFLPIRRLHEIDTYPLLEAIFSQGKTAVVSVSDFEKGTMSCYALGDTGLLAENSFGIPEPADTTGLQLIAPQEIDLILIPLLAYDRTGHRVGYGRGFYDRFLRQCRPDAVKAGLSFFPPEEQPISDTTPEDIPLGCCFTPEGRVEFKK